MRLSDFDYNLPKELIAQRPLEERDQSKLMVLDRETKTIGHHLFFELPELLDPNSVVVFNESRVIPARLKFKVGEGNAEVLLVKPTHDNTWECMVKPGNKFQPKMDISVDPELSLHIKDVLENGLRVIQFKCEDLKGYLRGHGHTPTPPYIKETLEDAERYQTIYSKAEGSVAAPTAGLHFTKRVLDGLRAKGIQTEFVTLHVGLGTFQPVKTEQIEEHQIHSEWFSLPADVAERLNKARLLGKRIVAVGTTTVRVLESCSDENGRLEPRFGETNIYIYPGYRWKFVDQMVTNFHVPKSTLLMLVSSFAGLEFIMEAYENAKKSGYRFFSFGDAMWIR
jgi:S-adenosylmethionine:tRNA ribosyltransferase-isomerase